MTDLSNSPIGKPLERREDLRFLTGAGQYTDDVVLPGQTYAYFLRSPYAHARIKSIDVSKAKAVVKAFVERVAKHDGPAPMSTVMAGACMTAPGMIPATRRIQLDELVGACVRACVR